MNERDLNQPLDVVALLCPQQLLLVLAGIAVLALIALGFTRATDAHYRMRGAQCAKLTRSARCKKRPLRESRQ